MVKRPSEYTYWNTGKGNSSSLKSLVLIKALGGHHNVAQLQIQFKETEWCFIFVSVKTTGVFIVAPLLF